MSASMSDINMPDVRLWAVIIYQDCAGAARVNDILERAANRLNETVRWSVMPWRQELLNVPAMAQAALAEALDAHLIAMVLQPGADPPAWLRNWLDTWAAWRRISDAALAVAGTRLSTPVKSELKEFARRRGLSFMDNEGEMAQKELSFSLHDGEAHEISLSPAIQSFVDEPTPGCYRPWGINE